MKQQRLQPNIDAIDVQKYIEVYCHIDVPQLPYKTMIYKNK